MPSLTLEERFEKLPSDLKEMVLSGLPPQGYYIDRENWIFAVYYFKGSKGNLMLLSYHASMVEVAEAIQAHRDNVEIEEIEEEELDD